MDMCREPQEGYGGNFKEKKQLPARSLSPNSCLHVIIIYKTESHEGKWDFKSSSIPTKHTLYIEHNG